MYEKMPLDYSQDALSPSLNREVLQIHYQIYQNDLNELNRLLNEVHYDYSYSLRDLIDHIDIFPLSVRGEILYYLSSVLNHDLYFFGISNRKNIWPIKTIERDIKKYFGTYEEFQRQFKSHAMNLKGSGYTFLVQDSKGELKIINTSNEDSPYYYGMIPIIGLDLWEHAYFLQYHNQRELYIDSFFQLIDFEKINTYYEQIKR